MKKLERLGFVYLEGGEVRLGSSTPTPCRLEGYRRNETPLRYTTVGPFWIAKFTVTNEEFQRFAPKFIPSLYSPSPRHPVTNVTYLNALGYAQWFAKKHRLNATLPTEEQFCFAAAPFDWEFTTGKDSPNKSQVKIWDKNEIGAVVVDDPRFPPNWAGLHHMGGNVLEFVLGTQYVAGTSGAATDGMVAVIKGGGFYHCPLSTSPRSRGVVDVALRCSEIGFRLVVNL